MDDDKSVREATSGLLRSVGYQVQAFDSAESLFSAGVLKNTECLILDVRMPGMDGLELQSRLSALGFRIPIIFITAHADSAVRKRALSAGAAGLLPKPYPARALLKTLHAVLEEVKACSG